MGNIRNNYLLCKRAIPHLKKAGKGSIVLLGSVSAYRADDTMGVYCIAKRGLMQMMENMAYRLGPDKIRVNCIIPGFIRTHASRPLWTNPAVMKCSEAAIPLQRIGEGDDIAGAAIFLCSAASGYVTGLSLPVEGGILLTGGIGSVIGAGDAFAESAVS